MCFVNFSKEVLLVKLANEVWNKQEVQVLYVHNRVSIILPKQHFQVLNESKPTPTFLNLRNV